MDMHENPITKQSISVRKLVDVFPNPILKYPKIEHSTVGKVYIKTHEFEHVL